MKPSDSNKNDIILKEHVYDGIQEYDQKLPNWWLFTLYITIVWFVFAWVAYYQLPFKMPTPHEKIDSQMALIENKKQEELETMMASINNESLQEMSLDMDHTASGQAIFEAKCIACHGQDLSAMMGGIKLPGVALIDDEWLYGAEPLNIMEIVTNGSPDVTKGMIAWNTQLSPAEIAQVVAYILSKQS
ncbi:MAG: cbb3-type cytochrome c oxidase N-terminal domain-containing protein [Verrucomicrobiales bacterium]|nr:cbb3-type cytochrome c oxidase N-terminal domain-containing protein [Verrucomicrobiales bacterium]